MFTWCWNAQYLQKKHSENDKRPVQHINRAIFTFYIYREWNMHQYLNAAKLGQHINFWVHNFKQQLGKKRRYTLLFFPIIWWKINILMKLTISNETKLNSECFDWWFRARSPRKQYTHMGKMEHIHWKSNPLAKYYELIFDEWDNNFRWFSFTSRAEYIIENGWHCNHVNHVKSNIRWMKQWFVSLQSTNWRFVITKCWYLSKGWFFLDVFCNIKCLMILSSTNY